MNNFVQTFSFHGYFLSSVQPLKTRLAFGNADLDADLSTSEDGKFCRPQSSSSREEKYLFLLTSDSTYFVDESDENLLVGKIVFSYLF